MKPNVTCRKCDGSGTHRDWLTNDDGKWYHRDETCPSCQGMGKHPDRTPTEYGYFAVHSTRASHLSVDEVMDLLEDTDE